MINIEYNIKLGVQWITKHSLNEEVVYIEGKNTVQSMLSQTLLTMLQKRVD